MDKKLAKKLKVTSFLLFFGSITFSKFDRNKGSLLHLFIELLLFISAMYLLWLIPKTGEYGGFFTMGKKRKYIVVELVGVMFLLIVYAIILNIFF